MASLVPNPSQESSPLEYDAIQTEDTSLVSSFVVSKILVVSLVCAGAQTIMVGIPTRTRAWRPRRTTGRSPMCGEADNDADVQLKPEHRLWAVHPCAGGNGPTRVKERKSTFPLTSGSYEDFQ
ncbi:hypothetical protein N7540_010704 [Penicillium herquei]|nr:hypothetical protein N7540_010704 [Penicillium herquei]